MKVPHQYSKRFQECIDIVLEHEGGYVNDQFDPGGETKYGISKRAFPNIDIQAITKQEAIRLYYEYYWVRVKGDQIISNELALQVFDMAVNAGPGVAIELLQKMLNTKVDGIIGPKTLAAMDSYPSVAGMIERYKYLRLKYYAVLIHKNPPLHRYLMGWINRIES